MNSQTKNSIIGGSATGFAVLLLVFFLPHTQDPNIPVTPIGEQIISNQTDNNEGSSSIVDTIEATSEDFILPADIIEVVVQTEVPSDSDANSNSVRSRSGGNGGSNNNSDDFGYQLRLFEGDLESDGVIDLEQDVDAVASTDDTHVEEINFKWIDPTNTIFKTETVPLESESAASHFEPNALGHWTIEADFGNGEVLRKDLEVSYLVIPESPVGIIALVAASIGSLGAFALIRGRSH